MTDLIFNVKPTHLLKLLSLWLLLSLTSACSTLLPVDEAGAKQTRGRTVLELTIEADQAYFRRDWQQAESLYREATEQDPAQAYLWFRLGNVLMYRSRLGEAREAYREAINRDQGFAKAWNNLATSHLLEAREALSYLHSHLQPGDPAIAPLAVRLSLLDEVLDQAPADVPSLARQLGINPFATLVETSGTLAMIFLIITLAITPVRRWLCFVSSCLSLKYGKRLSDWNYLIKSRRMLGLWSFFYASVHLGIYMQYEIGWDMADAWLDILERPFVAIGYTSWVILLVLAATSPTYLRKKMKSKWRTLHRAIYPLSLLALMHLVMESKIWNTDLVFYTIIIVILLLHRVIVRLNRSLYRKDDTGMDVHRLANRGNAGKQLN